MNHERARSLLMDYLYDEIGMEERHLLESYLEQHPDLRNELEELQRTRELLRKAPLSEPQLPHRLTMVEPRERTFGEWLGEAKALLPRTRLGKLGFAVAAGLMLLLFIGSVAKLQISTDRTGWSVAMGYSPTVTTSDGLTTGQAEVFLDRMRQENAALMAEYARTIRQENRQQLEQVVRYVEQQRLNDLQLIDRNLDQLQQTNNYRWQQTSRFLGEMMQTVNVRTDN